MRYFHYQSLDELKRGAGQVGAAHVVFKPDPERVRAIAVSFRTDLMRRKDHTLSQWSTGCAPFDMSPCGAIIKQARAAKRNRPA